MVDNLIRYKQNVIRLLMQKSSYLEQSIVYLNYKICGLQLVLIVLISVILHELNDCLKKKKICMYIHIYKYSLNYFTNILNSCL